MNYKLPSYADTMRMIKLEVERRTKQQDKFIAKMEKKVQRLQDEIRMVRVAL